MKKAAKAIANGLLHKRLWAILTLVLPVGLAIALSVFFMTSHVGLTLEDEHDDGSNLSNFVELVMLEDSEDFVIQDGQDVYIGADYKLYITFKETSEFQFLQNEEGYLTYQLPEDFLIVTPVTDEAITDAEDMTIGGYSVDLNGFVTMSLSQDGLDYFNSDAEASFTLPLCAGFQEGEETREILFGNGISFNVNVLSSVDEDEHDLLGGMEAQGFSGMGFEDEGPYALGDTDTFDAATWTIGGFPAYCQNSLLAGSWNIHGFTFTLKDPATATPSFPAMNPYAIWILVHGSVTPDEFAIQSGYTLVKDQNLSPTYLLSQATMFAGFHFTNGLPINDPYGIPDNLRGQLGVSKTSLTVKSSQWLAKNAKAMAPTSVHGTITIDTSESVIASDGTIGPLRVVASSGVPVVALTASSGQVVNAGGTSITHVLTDTANVSDRTFYVKNATLPVTVSASGTNVYVPGWMWWGDPDWQPLAYVYTSTATGSATIDATTASTTAVISGVKTVQGVDSTDKVFTFNLVRVTDATGNTEFSPSFARTATTTGAGNLSFSISDLTVGTYFYKVSETQSGTGDGWTYDNRSYIYQVDVTEVQSGVLTATVKNLGSTNVGTTASPNIPPEPTRTQNTFDPNATYKTYGSTLADKENPAYGTKDASLGDYYDFFIYGPGNVRYTAFCADLNLPDPMPGTTLVAKAGQPRDNSKAALAFALRDQNEFGGLTQDEFNSLFDFRTGSGCPPVTNEVQRKELMACATWHYDTDQYGSYNPSTGAPVGSPVNDSYYFGDMLTSIGLTMAHYNRVISVIDAMYSAYNHSATGTITTLAATYTSTGTGIGTITVTRSGYSPLKPTTMLVWNSPTDAPMTVKNGSTALQSGDVITVGQPITVTYSGQQCVEFIAYDSNLRYLENGSIKGTLLTNADTTKNGQAQDLIIGFASFRRISANVVLNGFDKVASFVNAYEPPPSTVTGGFYIYKHSNFATSNAVAGAKFTVYDASKLPAGTYGNLSALLAAYDQLAIDDPTSVILVSDATDANGYVLIDGLLPGSYYVRETTVPGAYDPSTGMIVVFKVEVDSEGVVTIIGSSTQHVDGNSTKNGKKVFYGKNTLRAWLRLWKHGVGDVVNSVWSWGAIGAKFTVYWWDNAQNKYVLYPYSLGNTLTTGQRPIDSIRNTQADKVIALLPNSKYYVVETVIPSGYDQNKPFSFYFETDENDEIKTYYVSEEAAGYGYSLTLADTSLSYGYGWYTDFLIRNHHKPITLQLQANKTAVGAALTANQFDFAVYEGYENPKKVGTRVATGKNDASGNILFSPITYTSVGTHTYTVVETSVTGGGWSCDGHTYQVTVNVTADANGALSATATYPEGGITFINTYGKGGFYIYKHDSFSYDNPVSGARFTIYDASKLPPGSYPNLNVLLAAYDQLAIDDPSAVVMVTEPTGSNGYLYVELPPGKYYVRETTVPAGFSSANSMIVVFQVDIDSSGKVQIVANSTAHVGVFATPEGVPLYYCKNSYNRCVIRLWKHGVGDYVPPPWNYGAIGAVFKIYRYTGTWAEWANDPFTINNPRYVPFPDASSNTMTTAQRPLAHVRNSQDTAIAVAANSIYYVVETTIPAGYEQDKPFSFYFETDQNNQIKNNRVVSNESAGYGYSLSSDDTDFSYEDRSFADFIIRNHHKPIKLQLEANKVALGSALVANQFDFAVYQGTAATGTPVATGKNSATGSIVFSEITYTSIGTYTYTIAETSVSGGGWVCDGTTYQVTVNVTADATGQLSAAVTYPTSGVTFTNTFEGGPELPETGGTGKTIFYVLGLLILSLVPIVLFVNSRRKKAAH